VAGSGSVAAEEKRVEPRGWVYVALLRGINVGGRNRLPMSGLRDIFSGVGCRRVETLIQSGNVVFEATQRVAALVPEAVSEGISKRFGFWIPVVTRSAAELQQAAETNPFLRTGVDVATLHVAFLAERPTVKRLVSLDPSRSPPDEFVAAGREVYLRLPNGGARSKFTNAYLDSKLETTSTVRNWRTVLKLVEMAASRRL
jgi:uncharacterized protein (DUF1697 family)